MKIDKDFVYYNGPGGGRTTKMLLNAIDLAQEPQSIIVIAHTRDYAVDLFYKTLTILDYNAPELGHLGYRPDFSTKAKINFPIIGSDIEFFSASDAVRHRSHVLSRIMAVSILFDHYALEAGDQRAIAYWQEIVNEIQHRNADKEIEA